MPTAAEMAAIERLQEMSPARRAAQLFVGTITNAANTGTAGALGAVGDLVRGTPTGTTGAQIAAQVRAASPVAAAGSDTIGMVAGLKGAAQLLKGARSIPTAVAAARSAGPAQGLRVLTNSAGPGLIPVTASKVSSGALAKGAGLLGLLGLNYAGQMDSSVGPAAPATARNGGLALDGGAAETSTQVTRQATPQDRAMAAIDSILSQPFTMREFEAATGALPQVASSSAKVSNKDKVFGAASGIADTLYQAQLAQAQKLSGDARDAAVLAATEQYRKNLLETLGVDPSKQALADIVAQQGN